MIWLLASRGWEALLAAGAAEGFSVGEAADGSWANNGASPADAKRKARERSRLNLCRMGFTSRDVSVDVRPLRARLQENCQRIAAQLLVLRLSALHQ
jgi:hypothetical protein